MIKLYLSALSAWDGTNFNHLREFIGMIEAYMKTDEKSQEEAEAIVKAVAIELGRTLLSKNIASANFRRIKKVLLTENKEIEGYGRDKKRNLDNACSIPSGLFDGL